MITRRNFCASLAALVAAPYVIRNSGVLMPIRDRSFRLLYAINTNVAALYPEPPLGSIYPFAGDPKHLPKGWLPFDGRTIQRDQYPELFAAKWNHLNSITLGRYRDVPITQAPIATKIGLI